MPGEHNGQADDLSHNRLSAFLEKVPETNHLPSPIPSSLLQWLLHSHLDCTSTHKTYQSAMCQFSSFCSLYAILSPFPVSEALFCYDASFLATQRLTPQTTKTYLSAIHYLQLMLGLPELREFSSLPQLRLGIQRTHNQRVSSPPRVLNYSWEGFLQNTPPPVPHGRNYAKRVSKQSESESRARGQLALFTKSKSLATDM